MPAQYGLIGFPLTHSFSPAYFKMKFAAQHIDAVYELYPMPVINELPVLLEANPGIVGLNVTTPHKESVIRYLQSLDTAAAVIGAVNCIVIKDGILRGYNTDATGFEQSLNPLLKPHHTQALILGSGGSSKAVAYTLGQLGIPFRKVSRKKMQGSYTYDELTADLIRQHRLIINTTPLGMYPLIDAAPPIPYDAITSQHLCYDLIYNPEETKFLALAKAQDATIKNGFEMLQLQAEASWEIWHQYIVEPA